MKKIKIGPITRTNNTVALEVTVENKKVVEARCSGIFFRGFEHILQGRDPRDAGYLTERVCGICSSAHATAASLALEQAAGVSPPRNGVLLRNLILGADFLQNHLRCFYLFCLPDYVPGPQLRPFKPCYTRDFRLPEHTAREITGHFFQSVETSRMSHDLVTLLGGKAPFSHGILAGGSTVPPTADIIMDFSYKLKKVNDFIKNAMVPDAYTLAGAYPDYYDIGVRKPNFLVYGLFPRDEKGEEKHFTAGVVLNGQRQSFDSTAIEEHLKNSWFTGESPGHPAQKKPRPDREKEEAYSWVKAPRYKGKAVEGGPLARLWLKGEYRRGVSTMDRIVARVLETEMIGKLMEGWLEELQPGEPVFNPFEVPREAESAGLTGAMRGPLGHWLRIEKGRIAHYQIITPTAWNFSPRDDEGKPGPVEEALVGTPVEDEDQPIEVSRVVRAFDVCSSCATHVLIPGSPAREHIICP